MAAPFPACTVTGCTQVHVTGEGCVTIRKAEGQFQLLAGANKSDDCKQAGDVSGQPETVTSPPAQPE